METYRAPADATEPPEVFAQNMAVGARIWAAAVAFFFVAFLFAFFYLRALNTHGKWNQHHLHPPLAWGIPILVCVLASAAVYAVAVWSLVEARALWWRLGAAAALQLGAAHRLLAALALPPLCALVAAAWIAHRRLLPPALAALCSFLAAALLTWRPAHLGLAGLAFAASFVLLAASLRGEALPPAPWRDYISLTKPRIMSLLLLTGAAGMLAAARGWPGTGALLATLGGLALACGGASALNHLLDRDIDRLMPRTGERPVAGERVAPARALEFGLALSAFSFVLLASLVNVLSALLALAGNLFYVLVYTRWLKRSTPQNIVIGGAAGALPPLVGWAGATGKLSLPALFP